MSELATVLILLISRATLCEVSGAYMPEMKVTYAGLPLAGAKVFVISSREAELRLKGGQAPVLAGEGVRHVGSSDELGKVEFNPVELDEASLVVVLHEKGIGVTDVKRARQSGGFSLSAWGKVRGTVQENGGTVGSGEIVRLVWRFEDDSNSPRIRLRRTTTNAQGKFEFGFVPPGTVEIYRVFPFSSAGLPHRVDVQSGQCAELIVGAHGRTLNGRVVREPGTLLRVVISQVHPERHRLGDPADDRLTRLRCSVAINDKGEFRTEALPPGEYVVTAVLYEGPHDGAELIGTKEVLVSVPHTPEGRSENALDVGVLMFD
jgi:hypothetical protein